MSNGRGGKKIKIVFASNEKGELSFEVQEIAYPHSSRSKKFSGSGVWVLWEQKCFHRPAQAFKELFFALRDLQLIDNVAGVIAAKDYYEAGAINTREKRLHVVEDEVKNIHLSLE